MNRPVLSCLAAAAILAVICLTARTTLVPAAEQAETLPNIIQAGFDAYQSDGPEAAMTAWAKGTWFEGNDQFIATQAQPLKEQERSYGKYQSHELLATKQVGRRSQFVYAAINYERGSLFIRFQLFKSSNGWLVQYAVFKPDAMDVMPWLSGSKGD